MKTSYIVNNFKKIRGRYFKAFGIIRLRMMSNVRLLLKRYEHQNFVRN